MVSRFKELWNETYNMLSFEIRRLGMECSRIDKQTVGDYYREKVVNGLWFSKSFVSDYNTWLWEHVEDNTKRNEIRIEMNSFDPPANSLWLAWCIIGIGATASISGIVFLFLLQLALGVITLLVGLALLACGGFLLQKNNGKTNLNAIKTEWNRIGDTIEQML